MTDRPAYSFGPAAPAEVSQFLRNKGMKPAFSWADVEPEEHATAFTVAKAMQADVLSDIRDAVQKAIDEGQTFEAFKKGLKPHLVKRGWWGEQEVVDPVTGKTKLVQLGSTKRLATIYDSNLRSARAAGQWTRIQRTKAVRPYLLYQLGPSERHRATHVAKKGLVLPVDDPFWLTWYPPNGWRCRCWVRQINRSEATRLGIREAPLVESRPWKNWRTGETIQVPHGIDPGWQSNPGAFRQRRMEELLTEKLTAADPAVTDVILRDVAGSWRMQRLMSGQSAGRLPVGRLPGGGFALADETTAAAWQALDGQLDADVLRQVPDVIANGTITTKIDGITELRGQVLSGGETVDVILRLTRMGDREVLSYIGRAADLPPTPTARWQYLEVAAPKGLDQIQTFIRDHKIAEVVKLDGMATRGIESSFVAMLEVTERFGLRPLTGIGPASKFDLGQVPADVSAAIFFYTKSDRLRHFHMPKNFGSKKRADQLLASYQAATDEYFDKQQGRLKYWGSGYAQEVQDRVPTMKPGDYHFTVDGLMAHGERQKAIVYHEYGHVVHKLTKDMGTEIQNFLDEEEPLKKGWDLLVSEYAGSEPDELVAESFGLYMQGEEQHYRVHPRLLAIFKKYDGYYAD